MEQARGSYLVLTLLLASRTTERLGVHALFAAFVAGLIMPKEQRFVAEVVERIESLTLAILFPVFSAKYMYAVPREVRMVKPMKKQLIANIALLISGRYSIRGAAAFL
jgi:Kef-type K+ transport system membrane component KefB